MKLKRYEYLVYTDNYEVAPNYGFFGMYNNRTTALECANAISNIPGTHSWVVRKEIYHHKEMEWDSDD